MDISRATELVKSCAQSLAYAAVQSPYDGISQLTNHVTGKEVLPKLMFVEEPKAAPFGTAEWHAQQLGSVLGTVADYILVSKLGGRASKRLAIFKEAENYSYRREFLRITSPALSGAVMEGVLRPVRPEEGSFWVARSKNALVGIYTYSAMGLAKAGVGSLAEKLGTAGKTNLASILDKKLVAGAIAGTASGGVHAEIRSILDKGHLATRQELTESAIRYALTGAIVLPLRGNAEGLRPFGYGLLPPAGAEFSNDHSRIYDNRWNHGPISGDKSVVSRHKMLSKDADHYIPAYLDRERFKSNLDTFERRANGQAISSSEVASTYDTLSKLLESKSNLMISAERRIALAQQVLEQAAHPNRIDQGNHNTCGLASVEDRLYTRHPAAIAQLIENISATGSYETREQQVVKLTPLSLIPDFEAQSNVPEDGRRCFASQLFEVTAANIAHQQVGKNGMTSEWYTQNPVAVNAKDTGERLYEKFSTGSKKFLISQSPQFYDSSFHKIYSSVAGSEASDFEMPGSSVPSKDSAKWLREHLLKLENDNQLPAYVTVHVDRKLLHKPAGDGSTHAINVIDFNPQTNKVKLDVHWGCEYAAHEYPLSELLDAMSPPNQKR